MDSKTIPQEQSVEMDGDNRQPNKPGLYRHAESEAQLVATTTAQADAYVRVGYEWQRDIEDSDFAALNVDEVDLVAEAKTEAARIIAEAKATARELAPPVEAPVQSTAVEGDTKTPEDTEPKPKPESKKEDK